ncbi:MAG TPA: hypothetical protein VEA63_02915, partial [Opitutus sp.]|nr:hypothetical protein [Opitutus sp.]
MDERHGELVWTRGCRELDVFQLCIHFVDGWIADLVDGFQVGAAANVHFEKALAVECGNHGVREFLVRDPQCGG